MRLHGHECIYEPEINRELIMILPPVTLTSGETIVIILVLILIFLVVKSK